MVPFDSRTDLPDDAASDGHRGDGIFDLFNVLLGVIKRSKMASDDKQFLESDEFYRSLAQHNLRADIIASLTICLLGVAGLVGNAVIKPGPLVFPAIPFWFAYLLILIVNVSHVLLLAGLRGLHNEPRLLLNVELLNQCINAVIGSLTILDTQVDSSYFLEFVIITVTVFILLYTRRGHGLLVIAISGLSLVAYLALLDQGIAWQDAYDLIMFYAMCWAGMIVRRLWFDGTQLFSHQLSTANRDLVERNRTDYLTGLLNRAALRDDFPSIVGPRIGVAMLDVDNFKEINDRFGHERGDFVLRTIARMIASQFSEKNERCYRYGGDEFLIVARDADKDVFEAKLEDIVAARAKSPELMNLDGVSVGYCFGASNNERNARSFLRVADDSLYIAKAEGKNRVIGREFHPEAFANDVADDNPKLVDPLTELYNYTGFERALKKHDGSICPGSILFFDVDCFQDINEKCGYQVGDDVLRTIARLIKDNFKEFVACRYDMDHFVVYSRDEDALEEAETVQSAIAHHVPHFHTFLRIGIYQLESEQTLADLSGAVDRAKYASDTLRRQHASLYRYYDAKLALEREREAFVLGHFDEALKNGSIVPYFQPVVSLVDDGKHGFEALARWEDSEFGALSPNIFVPVLERSFDANRLDSHMLERACALLETLPRETLERIYVSFNVSRNDFSIDDVPAAVARVTDAYKIPPQCIRIEVTESALNDGPWIRQALGTLRKRGYQIWLDDFGTGESSLNVLKDYEVDGVKLDKAFLQESTVDNGKSKIIIRALIQLCHAIGVSVVVEGVETREQLEFVRQCGCDLVQGYYFSEPLPIGRLLDSPFWTNLKA